jgi:hypothetical protein
VYCPDETGAKSQDRQCTYKPDIEARLRYHCCCGKAISFAYSESIFVASGSKYAKPVRHILLSSVACPAAPYFPHIFSLKHHEFPGKIIEYKTYVLIFSTRFV